MRTSPSPVLIRKNPRTLCENSCVSAPGAGFEPATTRLTVERSTAELPRNGNDACANALTQYAFCKAQYYHNQKDHPMQPYTLSPQKCHRCVSGGKKNNRHRCDAGINDSRLGAYYQNVPAADWLLQQKYHPPQAA